MSFLERNVRVLEGLDKGLAQTIQQVRKTKRIEVITTKNGMPTVRVDGLALHSSYDPVREADLQVGRFLEEEPGDGPIFALGSGLGYHLESLLRATHPSPVILVEPDVEVFRLALESREMEKVLTACRQLFVGKPLQEVLVGLEEWIRSRQAWRIFVHRPSMRMHPAYFERVVTRIKAKNATRGVSLNILIVPPVYGGSLPIAHYCARAFKKLGHRVTMIDNSTYHGLFKEIETVTSNSFHRRQLQGSLTQHLSEIVMAKVLDANPDLILALAQAPLTPDILERMRKFGILTAFWFVEDFRELTYWKEVAARYNHFFAIQNREVFEASETLEGIDFHYLPLACDPSVHRPMKLSDQDRRRFGSEVSFVGAGYHNRQMFFEGLLDFDFKIWGTEWNRLSPLGQVVQEGGRRVTTRETVKVFNASTISINLHSSTYHKGINPAGDFVNPRTFEIASSGGFQLVDPRTHLNELFEPSQEVACFESIEDLRDKILYYRSHREERARIAVGGQKRARKNHSYQKRMAGLLTVLIEENLPRFTDLKNRFQSSDRLITEAGPETELGRFLSRFEGEGHLTLDRIVSEIRQGEGKLTDPEVIFLLMHEFSKQKDRTLKEFGQGL
jgi:spore maturation protein CgeB